MGEPPRRRATYEDLLAAPPHAIAQLVDGELHVQPRPGGPHGIAASGLGADLVTPFQRGRGGPGGWIIVYEPELHFGEEVVVPDLAGWRAERPPELEAAFFTVVPAWVCEVLSPSSARLDRGRKADLYARVGVEFSWLVDPEENLIEAFRLADGAWLRQERISQLRCAPDSGASASNKLDDFGRKERPLALPGRALLELAGL